MYCNSQKDNIVAISYIIMYCEALLHTFHYEKPQSSAVESLNSREWILMQLPFSFCRSNISNWATKTENTERRQKRCRLGRTDSVEKPPAKDLKRISVSIYSVLLQKKTFLHFSFFFFFKYRVTSDTFEMTDTHLHVKWVLLFHVQQTNVYPV